MKKLKYGGYSYLHLGEKIDESTHLIATYYIESTLSLEKAAEAVAAESSTGTWTALSTMKQEILKDKAAKIIEIDHKKHIVKIAYPNSIWEVDNIAQLLSGIAGNIYGLKEITALRLLDVKFNKKFVTAFEGPAFGIEGVRDILGVYNRPLLGTIIKPKLGLSPSEHAKVAYEAWAGGVDIVKDDENLTSQSFNNFYRRIRLTLSLKRKAEEETGEKKIYLPNVTARPEEMLRRAQFVRQEGGSAVMIDILTAGLSAVEQLRAYDLDVVIHGHRAMHAALTRDVKWGMTMLFIAKLARLAGIDELHIGTVVGKMEGGRQEILEMHKALKQDWYGLKPVLHVASGGLHPGHVGALLSILQDKDVIINMGGGIHGHPDGTFAGAKAARQAIEIVSAGGKLEDVLKSKEPKELYKALKHWGIIDESGYKIGETQDSDGRLTYKNALVA